MIRRVRAYLQTIQPYCSVALLYGCSIAFLGLILLPQTPKTAQAQSPPGNQVSPPTAQTSSPILISGKPTRIVINEYGIDLPVDEGFYDESSNSWTLSESHAQFAMMTFLANNISGNTLIYGHGTDQVFGQLNELKPTATTTALVYTDNNHLFSYSFQSMLDYTPEDTSIFSYSGPPILTIQTCSGPLSEWRSMFQFKFDRIVR